ncbi:284cdc78-db6e-4aa7-9f31-aafa84451f66 [Thermothielavioides terrestris]|uniref:284cdc78-db6e-4aa7-9f31-aafa84451f66 n=1 Tax=Thermothielavioides terrestris TaxID=2587410 RepID=A0A3S4ATD8_9PEZI|nr:284cdc78-db6e-4aa7-9f31-aafa84451f66 [Thermothielavioides terrestris]
MKSAILTVGLVFGIIGASATIKYEYDQDGSVTVAYVVRDSPAPATARAKAARSASGGCSRCRDQCLRGVLSAASAAPDFCASFLAATYTAADDFAPVQTQCATDAGRVSSACSCLVQPTSSASSVSSSVPATSTVSSSTSTESSSTESSSTATPAPTAPACAPLGASCDLAHPELCCSMACHARGSAGGYCFDLGGGPGYQE